MVAAKKHLIYVAGPTASGKTAAAIHLATWLGTEIISCDSRQFFAELQIGAAPPTADELARVPHHFVQHLSVTENYNAGQFGRDALNKLDDLFAQHEVVIMVGGSGLYADAILFGFDDLPVASPEIRTNLAEVLKSEGLEALQAKLRAADPEYFAQADTHNPMRLIRALEVLEATGQKYSHLRKQQSGPRSFSHSILVMDVPREALYARINHRVDKMVESGLEEEARNLWPLAHLQTLNTVGYKEWFAHFRGEISREATISLIKQNTRRFAKRQGTWLRRYPNANWVAPNELTAMKKLVLAQLGSII